MEKVKKVFLDLYDGVELSISTPKNESLFLTLKDPKDLNYWACIQLDKSTAIKLHRELKRQIALIED